MRKRTRNIFLALAGILIVTAITVHSIYLYSVSRNNPPGGLGPLTVPEVSQVEGGLHRSGPNWFRKSETGLYELYLEGAPVERGLAMGALTKDLQHYQEEAFTAQINRLVPSTVNRYFLKYFIAWFNRDLGHHVPEEYKREIYGLSLTASPDYNYIAPPFHRILNYHAAHDIGHALQNMSLVGCTSFATWSSRSQDSLLLIGRNFDFYVGDDFARNKIVAFVNPDKGHKFMMITFAGMIGVLSGMNDAGLTVTLNAAKSEIPSAAATPASLVAREILQYASNIKEAYEIAARRNMFVSESFLIGSATDHRAAIIEKSMEQTGIFESGGHQLICTNHFQSEPFAHSERNVIHKKESASLYRYHRVEELLTRTAANTPERTVTILRDQKGLKDKNIGLGNEKAINQLIAHHSVVFQPEKRRVWVSTGPWQLGRYVCYDLQKVFSLDVSSDEEIYEPHLEIAADSFILTDAYRHFVKASKYRFPFADRADLHPDSIVRWNPHSYHAYMLAGDYYFQQRNYQKALEAYTTSLTLEIATEAEHRQIAKRMEACKIKLP